MAYIDAYTAAKLKEKLTYEPSQLGKLYKSKKNEYQLKSVEHNLVDDLLREGWEEYGKPLKTKTRLRKKKEFSTKFEDDIWCQLYDLDFRHLNFSNDFKLPFGKSKSDKKQIDVVAINDDSILLVECKSAKKPTKPPSYKSEFEGLPQRLNGFRKSLEQMFGKGKKIKYIFATRNIKLDRLSTDVERLTKTGSFFYNDNTFDYVNSLIQKYKNVAHYQFHALLFRGQEISKSPIEVPAIEGKMGGKTYYLFSIEPHLLLKMGFILHRTRVNDAEMPTYQRLLVPSRLKGISRFVQDGGYFPNSIIINFSTQNRRLNFEANSRGKDSNSRSGVLKIPNAYAIAYIIDGQHRVYGYASTDYKETNTIPVVAFKDLESTEQLEIFMDINQNQKAVSPTLRITLEEDLYWSSDRVDSRMKALRSSIIQGLGSSISGSLFNKISIGEDKAILSANPFANALSKSGLLPQAKVNSYVGDTSTSLYNIKNQNVDKEMSKTRDSIIAFINYCYQFVEDNFPEIYKSDKNFVISNRGTYAFICLIGSINSYESQIGNVDPSTKADVRFNKIEKYLKVLFNEITQLSEHEKQKLLNMLGAGADIAWLRSFQSIIHNKFKSFEPLELIDWKERQSKELQETGRRLGTEIEKNIKHHVIKTLKTIFCDNWDLEIGSIQRDCEKRAKEQSEKLYKEGLGRKDIPWTDQFFITDYKKIIEKYWTKKPDGDIDDFKTFEKIFSIDAGYGFNSKSEKIKWLSFFNSYRNNWAHEGTKEQGLNIEEVEFLKSIHTALDI